MPLYSGKLCMEIEATKNLREINFSLKTTNLMVLLALNLDLGESLLYEIGIENQFSTFFSFFRGKMRTQLALLLVTISTSVVVTSGQVASKCDPNICRLPSCYCGGTSVPGGLSRYA